MQVHFWDMDGTLVDGDVDTSWKAYLMEKGIAPPEARALTDFYYAQYERGELDQRAFARFQHAEFVGRDYAEVSAMAHDHFQACIRTRLYPKAVAWVREQQAEGHHLVLLTATSQELAEPVAEYLGFENLLATNLERMGGCYTGEIDEPYCGGPGKVAYIRPYLKGLGASIEQAFYYGDSMADTPVFEAVGQPVVCNPGETLRKLALRHGWPIHDFADNAPHTPVPQKERTTLGSTSEREPG